MEVIQKRKVKIVDQENEDCVIILTNAPQKDIILKILMADLDLYGAAWELTNNKNFYGKLLYDPGKDPSDNASAIDADEIYNMEGDQIKEEKVRI